MGAVQEGHQPQLPFCEGLGTALKFRASKGPHTRSLRRLVPQNHSKSERQEQAQKLLLQNLIKRWSAPILAIQAGSNHDGLKLSEP